MGWGFGADSVPLWELPEVTFLGGQGLWASLESGQLPQADDEAECASQVLDQTQ